MKKVIISFLIAFSTNLVSQNVGINSTGAAPNSSAMLDIASTSSGLLVPRMTAAQKTAIATPATGLLIYQTDAGTQGIGFYFYNGAAWVPFSTNNGGWGLLGNAGTASATNFIGTTDAVDFITKTNGTERMRILSTGEIGIGITAPLYALHVIGAANYTGRFENTGASNTGALIGRNTAATGTGGGSGLYGYTGQDGGFGVWGKNINTGGTAILGSGQNVVGSFLPAGSGGAFSGTGTGLVADASSASGMGIRGTGQGLTTYPSIAGGCGGAFSGTTMGVYGIANNTGNSTWGGYFTNGSATAYAYVGGRSAGGTDYKILGAGSVSTIVKNTKGDAVALYCPEAPEILFQDFGKGKLVNGFVHIDLDKDFAKNVTINEKHPLRVIIQLEGDCKGVYVTNHTSTGFDIKELQGGNSNVPFTYFVTANRADGETTNGEVGSKNADVRFGEAPLKMETTNEPKAYVKNMDEHTDNK